MADARLCLAVGTTTPLAGLPAEAGATAASGWLVSDDGLPELVFCRSILQIITRGQAVDYDGHQEQHETQAGIRAEVWMSVGGRLQFVGDHGGDRVALGEQGKVYLGRVADEHRHRHGFTQGPARRQKTGAADDARPRRRAAPPTRSDSLLGGDFSCQRRPLTLAVGHRAGRRHK